SFVKEGIEPAIIGTQIDPGTRIITAQLAHRQKFVQAYQFVLLSQLLHFSRVRENGNVRRIVPTKARGQGSIQITGRFHINGDVVGFGERGNHSLEGVLFFSTPNVEHVNRGRRSFSTSGEQSSCSTNAQASGYCTL